MFKVGDKVTLKPSDNACFDYVIDENIYRNANNVPDNNGDYLFIYDAKYGVVTSIDCDDTRYVAWYDQNDQIYSYGGPKQLDEVSMFITYNEQDGHKCELDYYKPYNMDKIIEDLDKLENGFKI